MFKVGDRVIVRDTMETGVVTFTGEYFVWFTKDRDGSDLLYNNDEITHAGPYAKHHIMARSICDGTED